MNTFLMDDEAGVADPVLWDRVAAPATAAFPRSRGSGDEPRFSNRLENTLLTLNTEEDTCRANREERTVLREARVILCKPFWRGVCCRRQRSCRPCRGWEIPPRAWVLSR